MPRPKLRTPVLRARLLDAAVDVLVADGVAGFTTRRVAQAAATSPSALFELFGDRAGLVRAVFFEGFTRLGDRLAAVERTDDPRADLEALVAELRRFCREQPVLAEVMFSRPFRDFDPEPEESAAGAAVRDQLVGAVQRAVDAGQLAGDATDGAHVVLALALGLASAERAARLGTTPASVDRRWRVGLTAVLDGLALPDP